MHAYTCTKGLGHTRGHRHTCIHVHMHVQICTKILKYIRDPDTGTHMHTCMFTHALEGLSTLGNTDAHTYIYTVLHSTVIQHI